MHAFPLDCFISSKCDMEFQASDKRRNEGCVSWKNWWIVKNLPNIIGYKQRDIYNVDESGLFIIWCLQELLFLKVTTAIVERFLKIVSLIYFVQMLTAMIKTPIVISKSWKLRRFNNVKTKPLCYEVNTKAWVTATIFSEWLKKKKHG